MIVVFRTYILVGRRFRDINEPVVQKPTGSIVKSMVKECNGAAYLFQKNLSSALVRVSRCKSVRH